MTQKLWYVKTYPNVADREAALKMALSPYTVAVLRSRGVADSNEIRQFLEPSIQYLPDPFLFRDMQKAIDRLLLSLQRQEHIVVYGDYDADGVTSTAVMVKGLRSLGFQQVTSYIPDRFDEGYGLNGDALKELLQQGMQVLITVDCGISAKEEGNLLKSAEVDWILTDHHQPGDETPDALAVLNPHCENEGYPFRFLAGVGVSFELIRALALCLEKIEILSDLLPFAAVGTVGDVVPLIGMNRILVKYGIEEINKGRSAGVRALLDASGIGKITSATQIAFQVVPKLNAGGRMAHADTALGVLLADKERAPLWASELDRLNNERKKTEQRIQEEALQQWLNMSEEDKKASAYVFYAPHWHHGVLGIVASRLSDSLKVPVFVCADDNNLIRGSGRAPQGYHLYQMLTQENDLWLKYGGHAQAAGISFEKSRLMEVRQRLQQSAKAVLEQNENETFTSIDVELDYTVDLVRQQQEFSCMEPFGSENEEPLVLLRHAQILQAKGLSQNQHIQLTFQFGPRRYTGFAWRSGEHLGDFHDFMDLAVRLQISQFRGKEEFRVEIVDWRSSRLDDYELMKEIRAHAIDSGFVYHLPESRMLLAESGYVPLQQLPQVQRNQTFPFLPLPVIGTAEKNELYWMDPPFQTNTPGKVLFQKDKEAEWKQILYWLLPDRIHLLSWYRWIKEKGQDLSLSQSQSNPGNLTEFLTEIALENVYYIFEKAGLGKKHQAMFVLLEPNGTKVDLEKVPEFLHIQEIRERLLDQGCS